MQDFHGVLAVLAGGVDVASDVEAVLGDDVAGQTAGGLLLGFQWADAALREVVRGPDPGVGGEAQHIVLAVTAEFEQFAAGLLPYGGLRAGNAGHSRQADGDGAAELQIKRLADLGGDDGKPLPDGAVPGVDEAAQRPLRLDRPDGAGVALGAVLVVPQQVSIMPISA